MTNIETQPGAKQTSKPTVTISTYSTLKRIERLQQEAAHEERSSTASELSTDFFKTAAAIQRALMDGKQGARAPTHPARPERPSRVLIDLSQIKGPTGSVRGHHNVVRRSLEGIKMAYNRRQHYNANASAAPDDPKTRSKFSTFLAPTSNRANAHGHLRHTSVRTGISLNNSLPHYIDPLFYRTDYLERLLEDEQNLCVAYTTTLGVIRRTFEDSKIVKSILSLNLIKYEERDIYLNQEYKYQLKIRMDSPINVPALFVDGKHIGGVKELEILNENGDLPKLLAKFKMSKPARRVCHCCGNAKFIACQSCNGSRKSTIHHFKFNSIALRCIKCDKNDGLVRCPVCFDECEFPTDDERDYPSLHSNEMQTAHGDSEENILARDRKSTNLVQQQPKLVDENNNIRADVFLNQELDQGISTC